MRRPPIPSLHYHDARAAIDFLRRAFGFEVQFINADESDPRIIYHAEMKFGDGLVMLGSALPTEVNQLYRWKTQREVGAVTSCISLIVDDVEAHHARAKAAGAEIIREPHQNRGYAGHTYDARDPEGYIWNVTTYDPWRGNQ